MSAGRGFNDVHLVDALEALPCIARWFVAEWAPWYGPDGPGDAESDLKACRSRSEVPLCLVALGGRLASRAGCDLPQTS